MTLTRAWHFLHPDLDWQTLALEERPPAWGGPHLTYQGGVALIAGDEAVRQAVLLLLSTRRGERLMRPTYGCDLHRLLFAPNNDATAGIAVYYVRRALEEWEPRVEILELAAAPHPQQPNLLSINLKYRIRASGGVDQLDLALDLMGES